MPWLGFSRDHRAGSRHTILRRDYETDPFHPAAVRQIPRDCETRRLGRACRIRIRIRILRISLPLLLGIPPLPELHTRANAVVWGLANPKIGEREAADEGFAGKEEKPRLGKLGGPTIPGVYSRVAGRALALALALATGIWHDWLIGAPNKRSLI